MVKDLEHAPGCWNTKVNKIGKGFYRDGRYTHEGTVVGARRYDRKSRKEKGEEMLEKKYMIWMRRKQKRKKNHKSLHGRKC